MFHHDEITGRRSLVGPASVGGREAGRTGTWQAFSGPARGARHAGTRLPTSVWWSPDGRFRDRRECGGIWEGARADAEVPGMSRGRDAPGGDMGWRIMYKGWRNGLTLCRASFTMYQANNISVSKASRHPIRSNPTRLDFSESSKRKPSAASPQGHMRDCGRRVRCRSGSVKPAHRGM